MSTHGVPQFAHYIVLPSNSGAPIADDWWTAESTSTPGEATISVSPGQTVYFNRTSNVSDKEGTLVPPEGIGGTAYEVTESSPSEVTVTMPSTGSVFRPELSGAEEWLLAEINQRRASAGASELEVSSTLTAAASEEARDEAVQHRWPDPYFFAVNQDLGWPGDIFNEDYAEADAPFSDPQLVLRHWDGDPSDPESPGIWQALSDPALHYVGIGDGAGAWIIQATDGCPDANDLGACGLTTDTGNADAWEPTEISVGAPVEGHTYTQGTQVPADYGCAAPSPAGVTVASCEGSVGVGESIDTSNPGAHSFTVTATDVNGDTTTRTVEYQVQEPEPTNLAPPTVSGNPVAGSLLTGTPGSWSANPSHYVYEWLRCPAADTRNGCQTMQNDDLPLSAGSDRYTVQSADYGSYLVLEVKGVNDAGYNVAYSSPVRVQATPPSLDPNHLPSVSGPSQPRVGEVLTGSPGQWAGTQPMLISYGWLRCPDTVISHCVGAQTSGDGRYTLTQADVGDRMLLVITAHNASGQSAKAFAASFTGVVEESLANLRQAAGNAQSASGQVGSVSAEALLANGEVSISVGAPGIIDLLASSTLISDKGLGLTQQEVEQLVQEIEAGLISDKGLGLVGDKLISDKGLGLVGGANASRAASRLPLIGSSASRAAAGPKPLFAGVHRFKRSGRGKVRLRLTKAGRKRLQIYERRAKAAKRKGHRLKPLQITLVSLAAPLHGNGDAVYHLRRVVLRP